MSLACRYWKCWYVEEGSMRCLHGCLVGEEYLDAVVGGSDVA